MSWAKLDDRFPRHRRVRELRRDTVAKWLHVVALCYCAEHLTDGRVDDIAFTQIVSDSELSRSAADRSSAKLEAVGLWIRDENGWVIRNYLDYNPPAHVVKAQRDARAEAGRLGGIRSGASRRGEANGEANASALLEANANPVPVPVPVPVPKDLSTHTGGKSWKVDGKVASEREQEDAGLILQAFNEVFGTRFAAKEWLAKIVMRLREHPASSVGDHRGVIERSFAAPWWTDAPSPAVVYGSAGLFEKALSAVGTPVNGSRPNMSYGKRDVSAREFLALGERLKAERLEAEIKQLEVST